MLFRSLLLLPGSIRPYKNAEALIAAFARLAASDLRLLIAGKADTPAYAKKLRALGGEDERIRFSFDFIPDDALQLYLSAADPAEIHHHYPVAEITDDAEVVTDDDVGELLLRTEFQQQVQDLSLHRDVEGRDGLVADQDARRNGQRTGHADPLPLAARELVDEAVLCGRRQADGGSEEHTSELKPLMRSS